MREIVANDEVLGGAPRLAGTRIGVHHIYRQYQAGASPESIASNYEDVSVADVHTALAFAFDNPEAIRSVEADEREALAEIRERRSVDPEDFKKRA